LRNVLRGVMWRHTHADVQGQVVSGVT
jgi:hypothetical protein